MTSDRGPRRERQSASESGVDEVTHDSCRCSSRPVFGVRMYMFACRRWFVEDSRQTVVCLNNASSGPHVVSVGYKCLPEQGDIR